MKKLYLLLLCCFLAAFSSYCLAEQKVPESTRSEKAVAKVKPDLEKELKAKGLNYGAPIFIRIFKDEKELEVWVKKGKSFELFKTYPICTYGWRGLGPKVEMGDGKAPEGFYFVTPNQLNPYSSYHLSFNLGYPNTYDRAHKRTGSALMVHGSCVSIGCYAMTDEKIEEIFALASQAFKDGQPFFRVHIFPFKMTDENMEAHKKSEWAGFWENLKEGYDFFEDNNHIAPNVEVKNKKYIFEKPKS